MDRMDLLQERINTEIDSLDLQIGLSVEDEEKVAYLQGYKEGLEKVLEFIEDMEE